MKLVLNLFSSIGRDGTLKFELSEKINDLGGKSALTPEQREEVRMIVAEMLKGAS